MYTPELIKSMVKYSCTFLSAGLYVEFRVSAQINGQKSIRYNNFCIVDTVDTADYVLSLRFIVKKKLGSHLVLSIYRKCGIGTCIWVVQVVIFIIFNLTSKLTTTGILNISCKSRKSLSFREQLYMEYSEIERNKYTNLKIKNQR